MDTPFLAFIGLMLVFIFSGLWFFRTTLKSLSDTAAEHAKTYALPYCKGLILVTIAVGNTFKEVFQPLTKEMVENFQWYDWVIKFSAPMLAGLAVAAAFLDRSFGNAQIKQEEKQNP